MKIFVEICVLKPKDVIGVVEALIKTGCAVVIRANAYDPCEPTIFIHGYSYGYGFEDVGFNVRNHFESIVGAIGGDIVESGEGHQDTQDQVAPPFDLSFAIDVLDEPSGIARRISCARYSRERAFKMMVEAAGMLANVVPKIPNSIGNALAHRLLLAALGDSEGFGFGTEADVEEMRKGEDGHLPCERCGEFLSFDDHVFCHACEPDLWGAPQ